jgi:hypothetical protein
MYDTKK